MTMFRGKPDIMMNSGPISTGNPDERFVPRIKPLYFCTNDKIRKYSKKKKFPVLYDPCPCSAGTYRRYVRAMLADIESKTPGAKENIVNNFLKVLPALREYSESSGKVSHCEICDEPCRNKICRRCKLSKIVWDK